MMMKHWPEMNTKQRWILCAEKSVGDLATNVSILVTDSTARKPYKYALEFKFEFFDLMNVTLNTVIRSGHPIQYWRKKYS